MAWSWRGEGSEPAGTLAGMVFDSQAEAEAWLGDNYQTLSDEGVRAVTLFEEDRPVYGPMSLDA